MGVTCDLLMYQSIPPSWVSTSHMVASVTDSVQF